MQQTTNRITTNAFVYHWLVKQCWDKGSKGNGVIEKAKAEVEMRVNGTIKASGEIVGCEARGIQAQKKRSIYSLTAARRLIRLFPVAVSHSHLSH